MGLVDTLGLVLAPERDSQFRRRRDRWMGPPPLETARCSVLPEEIGRMTAARCRSSRPALALRADLLVESWAGQGTMRQACGLAAVHATPVLGVNLAARLPG